MVANGAAVGVNVVVAAPVPIILPPGVVVVRATAPLARLVLLHRIFKLFRSQLLLLLAALLRDDSGLIALFDVFLFDRGALFSQRLLLFFLAALAFFNRPGLEVRQLAFALQE